MRRVFERISRGTAVVLLLVVLVVPAAVADDELPGSLDARINPPIGATEPGFLDWALIWVELGLLGPLF